MLQIILLTCNTHIHQTLKINNIALSFSSDGSLEGVYKLIQYWKETSFPDPLDTPPTATFQASHQSTMQTVILTVQSTIQSAIDPTKQPTKQSAIDRTKKSATIDPTKCHPKTLHNSSCLHNLPQNYLYKSILNHNDCPNKSTEKTEHCK